MDPKPHAKKLPQGLHLMSKTTLAGKTWEVRVLDTGKPITQNQKTPKLAVDRALAALAFN